MLDCHLLKTEVKKNLLRGWQQIEIKADPLSWAWTVCALASEGPNNNPLLVPALEQGKRWLRSGEAWEGDVPLPCIGLLCYALREVGDSICSEVTSLVVERLIQLQDRGVSKFSRLNDPDFVLGVVLGADGRLPEPFQTWSRQHCERNAEPGNWRRCLMFAAGAYELGGKISPLSINGGDLQIHELFPALWFAEKYPQLVDGDARRRGIWEALERVKDVIGWDDDANEGLYCASKIDMAMLYVALAHQTENIDPQVLFSNFPWHPMIRQAAEGLFLKGEYVMAVFQAGITFVDAVKRRSNHPIDRGGKPLDGVPLIEHVLISKDPLLKFTELNSMAEQNEHRGLALTAEGIVLAFRNPKGHVPQQSIPLGPSEALEQLAIISYLMRRLDVAIP